MLNIDFVTRVIREQASSEKISDSVMLDMSFDNDEMAGCKIHIDIMGRNDCSEEKFKVGEMTLYAYNISRCQCCEWERHFFDFDSSGELFDRINYIDDNGFYYNVLEKLYPLIRTEEQAVMCMNIEQYIVIVHRLFIEPEYRNKGIASYIMKNLYNLIYHQCNISSMYIVGAIHPDDKSEEMKNSLTRLIKRSNMILSECNGVDVFGVCPFVFDIAN